MGEFEFQSKINNMYTSDLTNNENAISNLRRGYNVLDSGLNGNGIVDNYSVLNDLLGLISTSPTDLYFPAGTYKLSASIAFLSNIRLIFANGAMLSPDSGDTVTINGEIEAGLWQIFSGSGTIVGTTANIQEAYAEWFGAIPNNTFDCTNAINNCLTAFKTCKLSKGKYVISNTINILQSYKLKGGFADLDNPTRTSFIVPSFNGIAIQVSNNYFELRDFVIIPKTANKWLYTGITYGTNDSTPSANGITDNVQVVEALIGYDGQECYTSSFLKLRTYSCKTCMMVRFGFNANTVQLHHFTYASQSPTAGVKGIHLTGGSINNFYGGEISSAEYGIYYDLNEPNSFNDIWLEWNTIDLHKVSTTGVMDFRGCNAIRITGDTKNIRTEYGEGKSTQRSMMSEGGFDFTKELKSYLIFDSLTPVFDYSLNGNHLSKNTLTPTLIDGTYGKAWNLTAQTANNYGTIPATALDVAKPITFMINFKFNGTQTNASPELLNIVNGTSYLRIWSKSNTYPALGVYTYNGTSVTNSNTTDYSVSGSAMGDKYSTMCITLDIPNSKIYTYNLYDHKVTEQAFDMSHMTGITAIRLFLDRYGSDYNYSINWIMFYNRILTWSEISILANQQFLSLPISTIKNILPLTATVTYDPASLADGVGATTTVTVTGAVLGDIVDVSFSLDLQGITLTAYVSSANTVTVRFQNESGSPVDLASGTIKVSVRKI